MGVGGQRHVTAALVLGKRPGTNSTGGWMGPRAGMDGCGKSRPPPGFDSRTVGARSESLYRLRYRANHKHAVNTVIFSGMGGNSSI
jgi:hypothetical protein